MTKRIQQLTQELRFIEKIVRSGAKVRILQQKIVTFAVGDDGDFGTATVVKERWQDVPLLREEEKITTINED